MPSISWTDQAHPYYSQDDGIVISPTRPSPCCATEMRDLGEEHHEHQYDFQVRACRVCGFSVRRIVREHDLNDYTDIRERIAKLGTRGMHGGYALRLQRHAARTGAE